MTKEAEKKKEESTVFSVSGAGKIEKLQATE